MTSLIELCRTEEQKKIARALTQIGLVTDSDLLLADEETFKRGHVSKPACGVSSVANISLSTNSVHRLYTPA